MNGRLERSTCIQCQQPTQKCLCAADAWLRSNKRRPISDSFVTLDDARTGWKSFRNALIGSAPFWILILWLWYR